MAGVHGTSQTVFLSITEWICNLVCFREIQYWSVAVATGGLPLMPESIHDQSTMVKHICKMFVHLMCCADDAWKGFTWHELSTRGCGSGRSSCCPGISPCWLWQVTEGSTVPIAAWGQRRGKQSTSGFVLVMPSKVINQTGKMEFIFNYSSCKPEVGNMFLSVKILHMSFKTDVTLFFPTGNQPENFILLLFLNTAIKKNKQEPYKGQQWQRFNKIIIATT